MAINLSDSGATRLSGGDDTAFCNLLSRARAGETEPLGRLLQWYANYLTILATTQLDRRLRRRVSPSDVVQETMLAAHQGFKDFRGQNQAELLTWLRQILINVLHRLFATHFKAEKRDIRRETSLDEVNSRIEKSAINLIAMLPSSGESPSAAMQARERAMELANQLGKLRSQYRDVIVYRVLQGLSFEEIGEQMDRPRYTPIAYLMASVGR